MLRKAMLLAAALGTLSACGHTPQERAASGALIGGAVGAVVGLASEPGYDDRHYDDRRYDRRHHRHDRRRHRHRDWDDYDDYDHHDDYDRRGCRYRC